MGVTAPSSNCPPCRPRHLCVCRAVEGVLIIMFDRVQDRHRQTDIQAGNASRTPIPPFHLCLIAASSFLVTCDPSMLLTTQVQADASGFVPRPSVRAPGALPALSHLPRIHTQPPYGPIDPLQPIECGCSSPRKRPVGRSCMHPYNDLDLTCSTAFHSFRLWGVGRRGQAGGRAGGRAGEGLTDLVDRSTAGWIERVDGLSGAGRPVWAGMWIGRGW